MISLLFNLIVDLILLAIGLGILGVICMVIYSIFDVKPDPNANTVNREDLYK